MLPDELLCHHVKHNEKKMIMSSTGSGLLVDQRIRKFHLMSKHGYFIFIPDIIPKFKNSIHRKLLKVKESLNLTDQEQLAPTFRE